MLPQNITHISGIMSACLVFVAMIPYYIDILRGHTKPQRAAAGIFAVLTTIAFFGQAAEGAHASLWFALAQLIGQYVLFALAIKYGMGGFSKQDKISLAFAFIILAVWYVTKSASLALILVVLVNTIAKYLISYKVYFSPHTELLFTWVVSIIASIFAIVSVGKIDWILLLVPVQNFITVGIIAGIIIVRRNQVKP